MEYVFSEYGRRSAVPSPVNRLMATFAYSFRDGVDINLSVGYVDEEAIPRQQIAEAAAAVTADPARYRAILNYGGSAGLTNLIVAIRRFYERFQIGQLTPSEMETLQIAIGPNGATSLLDGVAHLFPPGIVVTTDPMYYIYTNALERMGFSVLAVPEDERGMNPERVRAALERLGSQRERIRFFYVVTVNNPTSTVLASERVEPLVELVHALSAELGRKVPIFFDKAYAELVHDPALQPPVSSLKFDRWGLAFEIGSLSKILAPGLRIGYVLGRPGPLLDALIQRTSDVGFSASPFDQAIASYLLEHGIEAQLARVNRSYREKGRLVGRWIQEFLGSELESLRGGSAGFYYYLTFREIATHESSPFFRFLTRTTGDPAVDGPSESPLPRVLYLPGEHCVHPQGALVREGQRALRISYAYEPVERIQEALRWMAQAVQYAQKTPAGKTLSR